MLGLWAPAFGSAALGAVFQLSVVVVDLALFLFNATRRYGLEMTFGVTHYLEVPEDVQHVQRDTGRHADCSKKHRGA